MLNDATEYEINNISTSCTIPWSMFHYAFFSHLIDMEDRGLAKDIEFCIFAKNWQPEQQILDTFITMFMRTECAADFDEPARELVREVGKKFPNLRLNTK
jgi:hypothetical protein